MFPRVIDADGSGDITLDEFVRLGQQDKAFLMFLFPAESCRSTTATISCLPSIQGLPQPKVQLSLLSRNVHRVLRELV